MKIKCKVCRKETEINEFDYNPGEKVIVECNRCGNELEAIIPSREEIIPEIPKNEKSLPESLGPQSTLKSKPHPISKDDLKSVWNSTAVSGVNDNNEHPINAEKKEPTKVSSSNLNTINQNNQHRGSSSKPYSKTSSQTSYNDFNNINSIINKRSKDAASSSNKQWIYIILGLGIFFGAIIWIYKGVTGNNRNSIYASDSGPVYVDVAPVEVVDIEENGASYEESTDTVVEEAVEVVEVPAEEIPPIYLPLIDNYNSSQAYEVYPSYLTDEKMGEDWISMNLIQNAIHDNNITYYASGEGDIEGYPVSMRVARLKDGRVYGRYHNDYNGVKLDVNGAFDAHNNLVIKLGHKSETSYWILHYKGIIEDGHEIYEGTWGKSNKPSNLRLNIRQ